MMIVFRVVQLATILMLTMDGANRVRLMQLVMASILPVMLVSNVSTVAVAVAPVAPSNHQALIVPV